MFNCSSESSLMRSKFSIELAQTGREVSLTVSSKKIYETKTCTIMVGKLISPDSKRPVAVKKVLKTEELEKLTQKEIEVLNKLRGKKYILNLLAHFDNLNEIWLITELCSSRISAVIQTFGKDLKPGLIFYLMVPILSALNTVHQTGFIHRDIKPGNILIKNDGTPILADLGLARDKNIEYRTIFNFAGTALYMAPEVLLGKYQDELSDVFSFGLTCAELRNEKKSRLFYNTFAGLQDTREEMNHYLKLNEENERIEIENEIFDNLLVQSQGKNKFSSKSDLKEFDWLVFDLLTNSKLISLDRQRRQKPSELLENYNLQTCLDFHKDMGCSNVEMNSYLKFQKSLLQEYFYKKKPNQRLKANSIFNVKKLLDIHYENDEDLLSVPDEQH